MYVIMLYLCMYIYILFYTTLTRKNGLGRLPEYNNQSINQSIIKIMNSTALFLVNHEVIRCVACSRSINLNNY